MKSFGKEGLSHLFHRILFTLTGVTSFISFQMQ